MVIVVDDTEEKQPRSALVDRGCFRYGPRMIRDRVHRLRAFAAVGREAQARVHSEQRLADLDSAKLGFPQSSIVCAKSLRLAGKWPDLRSLARRPVFEESGLHRAEVVWFQDGAEMLSCLGRDGGRNQLDNWWWHLLLGHAPGPDRVTACFTTEPALASIALKRLAANNEIERFAFFVGPDRLAAIEHATGNPVLVRRPSNSSEVSLITNSNQSKIQMHHSIGSKADIKIDPNTIRVTGFDNLPLIASSTVLGSESLLPDGQAESVSIRSTVHLVKSATIPETVNDSPHPPELRQGTPRNPAHLASPIPHHEKFSDPDSPSLPETISPLTSDKPSTPTPAPEDCFRQNIFENISNAMPIDSTVAVDSLVDTRSNSDFLPITSRVLDPPLASPPTSTISTDFGGLLFVLDALLALNWIPDFTRPLDPGIGIVPLDYLLRLGSYRFGKRFSRDPLCEWLATQVDFESDIQPPPRIGELEDRIAQSLGLPRRRAIHLLCRNRAKLRISSGRVDADFRIQDHPLEIRMAGLDRDPGWIPSSGWDFRFHFTVTWQ